MSSPLPFAIIPLAGRGSRLLPLTYSIPKCLLPIGPRSTLHWAMREAHIAGVERIILIIDSKESLKAFFPKPTPKLRETSNNEEAEIHIIKEWADLLEISETIPYNASLPAGGFAGAIASAQERVGQNRFAVLLPDAIVCKPEQGLAAIVQAANAHDQWAIGLTEITRKQFKEFGAAQVERRPDESFKIISAFEKPGEGYQGQPIGIAGRYVFSADMFELIKEFPGWHPTDIINHKAHEKDVTGIMMQSPFFHVGIMEGYLSAWRYWASRPENSPVVAPST
jgi:UTP--glucose-1-phosphate uridylyltransferase